jgi:hypothetical protein
LQKINKSPWSITSNPSGGFLIFTRACRVGGYAGAGALQLLELAFRKANLQRHPKAGNFPDTYDVELYCLQEYFKH